MTRLLTLGSVLGALVLSTGSLFAQSPLTQGPLIRFDERKVDFGDMPQAAERNHRFTFRNDGTQPLKIQKVEASCGCTAAAPKDSVIAPGESSAIEVTFGSKDFAGEILKIVAVYSNDPAEPRIDLGIQANIIPFIQLESEWIDFGLVRRGTTPSAGALVSADEGTNFEITKVEGGESLVDWSVVPASAPGRIAYRLEARLKPEAPYGTFTDRIVMNVRHPNRQLQRIGLKGQVYSYFVYDKAAIEFLTIKEGKTVRRSLEITHDGSEPYEITDVVLDVPYLDPELKKTDKGYSLEVTLRAGDVKFEGVRQPFNEFARLITTDPNQKEIVIAITGVVRR